MRDVLLAEVTFKIKKKLAHKMAVEVCEIWWLYIFFLLYVTINFNCSITVCVPLALLEMRHSECEMVSTGSFYFLHRGTGKALLRFTSSITLALYFS